MKLEDHQPTTRQVLAAVVHDARAELKLNNPDYRSVGRMFADALEALDSALGAAHSVLSSEYAPPPIGGEVLRAPAPPEVRTRGRRK